MLSRLPESFALTVVTPSHAGNASQAASSTIVVTTFRYAFSFMETLAHGPGGIPAALSRNKLNYLLVPWLFAAMFFACLRAARKADVIYANWAICGLIGGLVGKILGRPVVTTLRGDDVTRSKRSLIDRMILRCCLQLSDRIAVVSKAIQLLISDQYPQTASKVSMIENGVDDAFLKIGADKSMPEKENKNMPLNVVTIGSLIRRKGVDTIIRAIEALKQQRNINLDIVGEGQLRNELQQLVSNCGLNDRIVFRGALAPNEIADVLRQSDLFVLSSYSEGRPNVVLEAMAAGLPVVATDIDGVRELVSDNKTGLLFKPGDFKSLSEKILYLHEHPGERTELGRAGHAEIIQRGLTWTQTAQHYARLFQQIVD